MYNMADIASIKNYMVAHRQTLAVAESVTSGNLQVAFSLADQATQFYQGGITTYNVGQKARHLNVNPIHALACNSVSEKVTEEMAIHALSLFSSDWSVAITGYAAPVPELGIKDLFAFYAIAFGGKVVQTKKIDAPHLGIYEAEVCFTGVVLHELSNFLIGRS